MSIDKNKLLDRFPSISEPEDKGKTNPAIQLYGRRFYVGQTPVEYLAEFLLVFVSPKGNDKIGAYSLQLVLDNSLLRYWPKDCVALKLFVFFPSSKLVTRHLVHRKTYLEALDAIKKCVNGSTEERDTTIRLIQSLFAGFVGVAKNRTWVTNSFFPVSSALLARELDWLHVKAMKNPGLQSWNDARKYFATDRHNFMARGGELLFLQLAHLFSDKGYLGIESLRSNTSYEHLEQIDLVKLRTSIETELKIILQDAASSINSLASFIEKTLNDYRLYDDIKPAPLGWVPTASLSEAFLFANELNNVCLSKYGALEKIDFLQLLCCMQVLRSFCCQARRFDDFNNSIDGFFGQYVWIVADPDADSGSGIRKLAQKSFESIEEMLYRVLRDVAKSLDEKPQDFTEADKNGFQIFRKIAKEIGLVIPNTGRGQRFVLPPHILRFLVAALLSPGERVRLTEFYSRVFAHYGIALGDRQLASALAWSGNESGNKDYAVAADTAWIEEALQQGGFLVELSDAVSIVHNPGGVEQRI